MFNYAYFCGLHKTQEDLHVFCLSSWCIVIAVWLFLAMPRVCLQFVIVVLPDHTHLLFMR